MISDSKSQLRCLTHLMGALKSTKEISKESYDTFTTKCAIYATKLLKRPTQCRAVVQCSYLFWTKVKERI
jgi:vacuolar protein sorting-associated protein 35